ncbi:MAG: hypothetical protein AB8B74_02695 [Crocinitomicaceae bacterium]
MMLKLVNVLALIFVICIAASFTSVDSIKYVKSSLYKVIKVNGQILFEKTGTNLKTGDAYIEGTPLTFTSNKDRAAIVNKIKGRFILQSNSKGKATVLPATSNIAARGSGSVLLNFLDVKHYFSDTCVFIGGVKVILGKETFPINDDNFFYVTYPYNGEKIAKKIKVMDQVLLIEESSIFEIDGVRIPTFSTEMTLYFMKEDVPRKVSSFVPLFLSEEELKLEVEVLLAEISTFTVDKKIDEVGTYISEFYGKPQKENLSNWLYKNFDLVIKEEINFK